jgi:hypothetical protein
MAGTTALVIAMELLAAARLARSGDVSLPAPLAAVRGHLEHIGLQADNATSFAPESLAAAAEFVRSGKLAASPGVELPTVAA